MYILYNVWFQVQVCLLAGDVWMPYGHTKAIANIIILSVSSIFLFLQTILC